MKKIVYTIMTFFISITAVNAQKGIDFSTNYAAGGKMLMNVDSSAKNVLYALKFPNQPNTTFNFIPGVHQTSIQINFRKTDSVQHYRYTILENNKPLLLNKSIDIAQLTNNHAEGDDEIFRSATFGVFNTKGKITTILTYNIQKPLDIQTTVFYGKTIPKALIKGISKIFRTDKGVDYKWIVNPKNSTKLTFSGKDEEIILVKDRSDIDYVYYATVIDKQTNKVVFKSTAWQYGYIGEDGRALPYVNIGKEVFKESGDYEIIIQPLINWTNCVNCNISTQETERYTTRHKLSVEVEDNSYTKTELAIYLTIICAVFGGIFGWTLTYIQKKNQRKILTEQNQKKISRAKLDSIRSQLNPHFMFNALAGIQSLMNQHKIEEANQYLSRFSRLTRNVLDRKELISLAEEKNLLEDYLEMEQYRFGFQYQISVDDDVDLNVEMPAMLLQPFVENAVKHGISSKPSSGAIEISFGKENQSLMITVKDNGIGFNTNTSYGGLGLQLSKDRINLLNSIYPDAKFEFHMNSTENGTEIKIIIVDWL